MIQIERVRVLNNRKARNGRYVLYWMQASQRSRCNHALEYAIMRANELNKPVLVFFGITDSYPEANERHYWFMLEGLREVQLSLRERGIGMVIWRKSPEAGVVELSRDASLVVVDRGYLRIQREWRSYASMHIDCPLVQVETDVVVPVETASPKEEYSAATLRPKIRKVLGHYLVPPEEVHPRVDSLNVDLDSFDIEDVAKAVSVLAVDRSVGRTKAFRGGTGEALRLLREFVESKLDGYPELRNDPGLDHLSNLSPYLHFGQISPLDVALTVLATDSPGREAYLEELVVRRELSMNFVFYNWSYDKFDALPGWAGKTLFAHADDAREYTYTLEELENARTHDSYWNAAQQEMRVNGKMHGYMRMYWGKKIIEWSRSPEEAFKTALYLNNKYELDGRDPNGFAGVAWCFGKHDRPWGERRVVGKVRYMSSTGLRRKFDPDRYLRSVARMVAAQGRD